MTDLTVLHAALLRLPEFADLPFDALMPMFAKGLVHEHIRIAGRAAVARIPQWSQFGLAPESNLRYQAACFERAGPSGATPRLRGVVPVGPGLPFGAVIVDDIAGRTPRLPDDLPSIADSLASIHVLPLPPPSARPPLFVHSDPVAGALGIIESQAEFLPRADVDADAMAQIGEELAWARRFAAEADGRDQPITLVGTDSHPGNFLIERGGRAVFVDLEKALYGSPAIDLAHVSVYTSTMWDPDIAISLEADTVESFYAHYLDRVPAALADRLRPWLIPMRRLTWLRTTTWCAKWRVESGSVPDTALSAAESRRRDPAVMAQTRARIDDYFNPGTIDRIRAEWKGA